jgi:hypothetical protein
MLHTTENHEHLIAKLERIITKPMALFCVGMGADRWRH